MKIMKMNVNLKASPVSVDLRRSAVNMGIEHGNIGSLAGRIQELTQVLHRRNINIRYIQVLKWKTTLSMDIRHNYQLFYYL